MKDQLKTIIDALVPIINTISDLTEESYTELYTVDEDGDEEVYFYDDEAPPDAKEREVKYRITAQEIVKALFDRIHDDADKAGMTQMDIDNEEAEKQALFEITGIKEDWDEVDGNS